MWECDSSDGNYKTWISRLSGAESIVGQHCKFEFNVLLNKKPVKMFKNVRCVCVVWENMTGKFAFVAD